MKETKTNKTLRHMEYYDMTDDFDELYFKSENKMIFSDLMGFVMKANNIKLAYRNIKKNRGSYTAGVDKQTIKNIEAMEENEFVKTVQTRLSSYSPRAVKRVDIPKPNGETRPLGIPTIMDRILQQCILQVLEPICEAKFHNNSYGFRPNRSAHHAIAKCYRLMNISKLQFVVDIDIKSFFDNVNHSKLIRQMWTLGIQDRWLLGIVRAMLRAPIILPNKKVLHPKKGTPQGGVLSPLLSNIVLNELDWWIVSQWEDMPGKSKSARVLDRTAEGKGLDKGNKYKELRKSNLKEIYIVRYADDFKIFCRKRSHANAIYYAVKQWLRARLTLDINEDKSKIINLKKKSSEFLGFELKLMRKEQKYVVESHVSRKSLKRIHKNLKNHLKKLMKPINQNTQLDELRKYNSIVIGIHFYYRVATQVSADFAKINQSISRVVNRRLPTKKEGNILNLFIKKYYGKSKQVRWLQKCPIVPLGYIKHRKVMSLNSRVNKYTKEGRQFIHKTLDFSPTTLTQMMAASKIKRSIEYIDNRISKYSSQRGKCGITGELLDLTDIHCHHIVPKHLGGSDKYQNLIILHQDIHKLIHAKKQSIITLYLKRLKLSSLQIEKVNQLRVQANNSVLMVN
ncbi:group II intron reverse transcriptase/maturase [Listeria monocytogenes]|nr:group II intron reverse transcriptase/maturase [Listeria monocytogenes]ELQ8354508.1 group II intron reverse transcriptase/maturase [Listeria monocytogenes]